MQELPLVMLSDGAGIVDAVGTCPSHFTRQSCYIAMTDAGKRDLLFKHSA